jgi:predicted ArsR family transcriptional regulator
MSVTMLPIADFTYAKYMNYQTRQILRLLADDVTGRMIDALRESPATIPELVSATGASQKTVAQTVELLAALGLLDPEPPAAPRTGRPARRWRLSNDRQLRGFERACEQLRAQLLKAQLRVLEEVRGGD